ncbi:hypothetical protein SAMN05421768_10826 [Chryseobacterium joostei]|nr:MULTISPECIES: hypothetical protein [Chryseobacterium]SIS30588.1 hypothetical protein SAMN05421768_10227 [Chryseobacterium joostei]SIS46292.1 hypothetical protein SAMN05421768_10826 [Chryseobacterium joostei]
MKSIFPAKVKLGRFFLGFLLFTNFHVIQAIVKSQEVYVEPDTNNIFISKGTTVSGLKYLHVSHTDVKKNKNRFITSKKRAIIKKRILKKTKPKLSEIKQKSKTSYGFSSTTKSDQSLYSYGSKIVYAFGAGSFSFKCIVTDDLKTIIIIIILLHIFLINFYKGHISFACYFSKKFQRPPPEKFFLYNCI